MARYKQMRDRMLNWADWKVRQKDGIGRYARMRWEAPTEPQSLMPWEADVVRPDEQDAWEIDKALRQISLPTELRATVECYYLDRRLTEREKLERLQVAKTTMYDRLDRVDFLLLRHLSTQRKTMTFSPSCVIQVGACEDSGAVQKVLERNDTELRFKYLTGKRK